MFLGVRELCGGNVYARLSDSLMLGHVIAHGRQDKMQGIVSIMLAGGNSCGDGQGILPFLLDIVRINRTGLSFRGCMGGRSIHLDTTPQNSPKHHLPHLLPRLDPIMREIRHSFFTFPIQQFQIRVRPFRRFAFFF